MNKGEAKLSFSWVFWRACRYSPISAAKSGRKMTVLLLFALKVVNWISNQNKPGHIAACMFSHHKRQS